MKLHNQYCHKFARNHDENMFDHLFQVIEHQFSPEDKERFLKKTLPCLARYAIALPDLKPPKFEYILASKPTKFNLDRKFVASLAANAFVSSLCKKSKRLWPHGLPDITFATLFPLLSSDFCSALRFKGELIQGHLNRWTSQLGLGCTTGGLERVVSVHKST